MTDGDRRRSFPRQRSQAATGAVAEHDAIRLAEAMLADVLAAASGIGRLFVVAPGAPTLPDGVQHVPDPRRGQGAAVRAALDAAVSAGAPAPYLVVNADLPCATPRDLLALAGAVPDGGLAVAARPTGRRTRSRSRDDELFEPLYGPGSAERFAALGAVALVDAPNLVDDVDTLADLDAARRAPRPAHARALLDALRLGTRRVKVAVLSGGVGGARFLRGLVGVVDPADVSIVGNVGDDLEVLGLHVSPDLDSVLYTLTGLADEERGWGRADETWHALDTVARARRRVVVPARRPRHRPAPRAHAAAARGRAALRGDGADRARARPRGGAAARDRRSAADVPRDARRHVPVPDVVRRARPSRRGRRRPLRRRARGASRRPGVLEALRRGRRDRDRAEQPVRLDRPDPRGRRDPRRARAAHGAVRRGQPARRRPRGQGPGRPDARAGSPAGRRPRTSPAATRG